MAESDPLSGPHGFPQREAEADCTGDGAIARLV
jgi:hypothetical protein